MDPCGGTMGVTALANLLAEGLTNEELELLLLSVTQFKITLENILLARAIIKRQGAIFGETPAPTTPVLRTPPGRRRR